ncbi:hypothetical protein ES703_101126 [subsurface metagenome]
MAELMKCPKCGELLEDMAAEIHSSAVCRIYEDGHMPL